MDEPIANSSMLVLPRITAPASRSRSVMWRVVRRAIALEDARAGGALAARHRHEVLQGDRDPEEGRQPVERRPALGAGHGEPRVGRVGLRERALAIDRQPGIECAVVALGRGQVGFGQLARRDLARAQKRGHLVGMKTRQIGHRTVSARRGWPGPR